MHRHVDALASDRSELSEAPATQASLSPSTTTLINGHGGPHSASLRYDTTRYHTISASLPTYTYILLDSNLGTVHTKIHFDAHSLTGHEATPSSTLGPTSPQSRSSSSLFRHDKPSPLNHTLHQRVFSIDKPRIFNFISAANLGGWIWIRMDGSGCRGFGRAWMIVTCWIPPNAQMYRHCSFVS
jgi:hypothetical protein